MTAAVNVENACLFVSFISVRVTRNVSFKYISYELSCQMSNDDERLLITRILATPGGQEVATAFFATLFRTCDPGESVNVAKRVAEENGTLVAWQISLVTDFLREIGPAA